MGGALGETKMCGSIAITQGLGVVMVKSGTNDKHKDKVLTQRIRTDLDVCKFG
jgi:hypothetical protein